MAKEMWQLAAISLKSGIRARMFLHATSVAIVCAATCALLLACGGSTEPERQPNQGPQPILTAINVTLSEDTIRVGERTSASASGLDQDGRPIGIDHISWSSSSPNVATVDGSGVITALSQGATRITAQAGGKSGNALITIRPPLPAIVSFTPSHAAYGFTVTITGSGFDGATTVSINGVAARVVSVNTTTLVVELPVNASSGPITVSNSEGTASSSSSFTVDPYGPPIVINSGGTYSGNWQSLDVATAAVTVTTSDPVIIQNCRIQSVTDGVRAYNGHVDLTVRGCTGTALNPNVSGMKTGFFVVASNPAALTVEHSQMSGFNVAAYAVNYPPSTAEGTSGQKIAFRYNIVHDIEGRFSDGHGGFQTGNFGEGTSGPAGAFTTYFVRNATIDISWNEIVNAPYVSQPEDAINVPESRGLPGAPIDIHDNYIEGDRPANAATYTTFSGCGIQTGDSPSKSDVGFVHVHDNQVVGFSSCGLSISSGHDIEIEHNRAISARTLPDGTLMANQWRVPLQMVDVYWDTGFQNIVVSDQFWYNNSIHDNEFTAVTRDGALASPTFYQLGATVTQRNNIDALGHLASTADEVAEYIRWKQKLEAAAVKPGP